MTEIRARAIFGSHDSDAVTVAKRLGAVVAQRGQILLTGGTKCGTTSVKESAICGAGSSPWVGVGRDNRIYTSEAGTGFVIYTDLGHKPGAPSARRPA
jgi:hypothetical protein